LSKPSPVASAPGAGVDKMAPPASPANAAMLEHPALLLPPPGPDGARPILDADSRKKVGFAAWRPLPGLRGWLSGSVLKVHEEEDAPLLFTVGRRWKGSARHEVRDAEGYG